MKKLFFSAVVVIIVLAGCGSSGSGSSYADRSSSPLIATQPVLVVSLDGVPNGLIVGGVNVELTLPDGVTVDAGEDGEVLELYGSGELTVATFRAGTLRMITISVHGMQQGAVFTVPLIGYTEASGEITIVRTQVIDVNTAEIPGAYISVRVEP